MIHEVEGRIYGGGNVLFHNNACFAVENFEPAATAVCDVRQEDALVAYGAPRG